MKFSQLIEYKREIFFFENYAENETGRLVPDLFLFFEKLNMNVKASGCSLVSIYCNSPQFAIQ